MTVCYFGIYNTNHTRNRLMIQGLRLNGVEVLECNTRDQSLRKYWKLIALHWKIRKQYDVMVVGFPGHTIMPLAWLLARLNGKKIIFDAFISQYDSIIFDERKYEPGSFQAIKFWIVDWLASQLADIIMLEVWEYAKYFMRTFKVPQRKFRVVYVGCDDTVIYPREQQKSGSDFLVHFHGTYIPAQGIPYIIEAAHELANEGVHFNIIGRLSTYTETLEHAKRLGLNNVTFIDFVPYAALADYMAQADICLGMFGNTDKAKRAGAFKIIEAMAMRKALITADTPAIREFLSDGKNALLCKIADGRDLAAKIRMLRDDAGLRERIAAAGHELFKKRMTPRALGAELKAICAQLIAHEE